MITVKTSVVLTLYSSLQTLLPCVQLARPVIVFTAPLPHAKVWGAVCALNIEDQVLHEVYLVGGEDYLSDPKGTDHCS